GLRRFIESRGGVQKRFKRGYRNVIDEAKRLCDEGIDAPLAIESSGHAAFADHYFLDDGAYFIAKILIVLSQLKKEDLTLGDLIVDLEEPYEEKDIRLNFTCDDWQALAQKIISRLSAMSERMLFLTGDNYEGVRAYVLHADGYFIVRTSVHDPVLPIYIESNKPGGAQSIARLLYSFLYGFRGLDCTPLYDYISEEYEEYDEEEQSDEAYDDTDAEEVSDGVAQEAFETDDTAEEVEENAPDNGFGFESDGLTLEDGASDEVYSADNFGYDDVHTDGDE
ncbi:MAG: hypothetical protein J1F71_03430, partial [Clostridiales bacterium]|nr:hypothetical protein [Clostridiales bacterium]